MKIIKKVTRGLSLLIIAGSYAQASTDLALTDNAKDNTKPNIIYILADDLGYGDIGAYGQEKIKTPYLDQMAKQGMRFTQHYAGAPVCGPSRASLMTGLHSGHSPVRGNPKWTRTGQPVDLKPEDVTVAEVLQQAGYRTGAIGKWGLAETDDPTNAAMPLQQGFDYFYGYKTHKAAHHYYWDKMYRNNDISIIEGNDYLNNKGTYTHDILTQEALSFIKDNDDEKPFFLYLAYTIPHLAITVPEDSKEAYKNLGWPQRKMNTKGHYRNDSDGNVAYAGMVSRMDRDIGSLLKTLKDQGLDENTLVVFTSDHGHEFDKEFFNSNGPFKGRKRALYEGGIRAPFIAWWPKTIQENQTSEHIFASWDLMATACELAKIEKCQASDGISYVPAMLGESQKQAKHDYLYWEFNEKQGPIQAVRGGDWKMVRFQGKAPELYNLKSDIGEENNIADSHPDQVARMTGIMSQAHVDHPEFPLTPVSRMLDTLKSKNKGKSKNKKKQNKS